jgi:hypothetical protein
VSKRFEAKVLGLRPDFGVREGHFYYLPVGRILCGFVCEKARGRARISQFARPLYERLDFLNLNFSECLPPADGLMEEFGSDSAAAEEFVRRIELYEGQTRTWQDLQTFLHHFERPPALKHPGVRRSIAWTYLMLGMPREARAHLELLLGCATAAQFPPAFLEDVRYILSAPGIPSGLSPGVDCGAPRSELASATARRTCRTSFVVRAHAGENPRDLVRQVALDSRQADLRTDLHPQESRFH